MQFVSQKDKLFMFFFLQSAPQSMRLVLRGIHINDGTFLHYIVPVDNLLSSFLILSCDWSEKNILFANCPSLNSVLTIRCKPVIFKFGFTTAIHLRTTTIFVTPCMITCVFMFIVPVLNHCLHPDLLLGTYTIKPIDRATNYCCSWP